MYSVDNAIIMAAGISSRFAPLSYEKPKALIEVRGEVLIERQIRQLREAGISEILVVTGYKAEMFEYLKDKFDVKLIWNPEYLLRNNHASLYVAKEYLKNTYICSADNYFVKNPFENRVSKSYYAAVYAEGPTKEWCILCDESERITQVRVGGENSWYMLGHAFFDQTFSEQFKIFLENEYDCSETLDKFWEDIYVDHLDVLDMSIRKYEKGIINEFDSLDELREFDNRYVHNTSSSIIEHISCELKCQQSEITAIIPVRNRTDVVGFSFSYQGIEYRYLYAEGTLAKVDL